MFKTLNELGYTLNLPRTFEAYVRGSIGSRQYRSIWVNTPDGGTVDSCNDGDLACALYVSWILFPLGLIRRGPHSLVQEVEDDLISSGWRRSRRPELGSVVIWAEKDGDDGRRHRHIGLCLDSYTAVCTDPRKKSPQHQMIYELRDNEGNIRSVEAIYAHPAFG